MSLDKETYRAAFHREVAALATAARRDPNAAITPCPGWTMPILLMHLTGIYAYRIALLRAGAQQHLDTSYEKLGLPPQFKAWSDAEDDAAATQALPPAPPGLTELFETTAATLEEVLWSVAPETPVWTWFPPDQTAGFWQRRMAQETAVHRWDAELSAGMEPQSIEPALARDGIDEVLDVMIAAGRGRGETLHQGSGETYHFHCTDGPGEWLVRFEGKDVSITREHAKGDVAVRGTASDLLLFLWGRIPAERLEVFGDRAVLDRFRDLAGAG
jgi:uncharacterized protein (TIGR03083 family)